MMTEICQYLNNWFDRDQPKHFGTFSISGHNISSSSNGDMGIKTGQYFRIIGSALNDGVWTNGDERLRDETFDGAVWLMAVPPAVCSIALEISQWMAQYGGVSSSMMSPFNSESFAGYSYTKSSGNSSANGKGAGGWKDAFSFRLAGWKKL